jgi:hypothetical protein
VAALALVGLLLTTAGAVAHNYVLPHGRVAFAAASRYVLDEWRPGDAVRSNAWEQGYYFRHLGDKAARGADQAGRLWLVIEAATAEDREAVLCAMTPAGWEAVRRREFYRATVVLLQPGNQKADVGRQNELACAPSDF